MTGKGSLQPAVVSGVSVGHIFQYSCFFNVFYIVVSFEITYVCILRVCLIL